MSDRLEEDEYKNRWIAMMNRPADEGGTGGYIGEDKLLQTEPERIYTEARGPTASEAQGLKNKFDAAADEAWENYNSNYRADTPVNWDEEIKPGIAAVNKSNEDFILSRQQSQRDWCLSNPKACEEMAREEGDPSTAPFRTTGVGRGKTPLGTSTGGIADPVRDTQNAQQLNRAREASLRSMLDAMKEQGFTKPLEPEKLDALYQCFLFAKLDEIVQKWHKIEKPGKSRKYPGRFTMLRGEPSEIPNKFMLRPGAASIDDIPTSVFSRLVPMVRLFKVYHGPSGNKPPVDIEMKFANHVNPNNIDAMLKSGQARGRGVGVKNFSWQFEGQSQYTSRKDVKAKLVLYFQDFQDITRARTVQTDSGPYTYSYLDLISHTAGHASAPNGYGPGRTGNKRHYNPRYYQIKAVCGWAFPKDKQYLQDMPDQWKTAIEGSQTTMMLTLTDHEFKVNEDGTMELAISYIAYMESALATPDTDIFSLAPGVRDQLDQLKTLATAVSNVCDAEAIDAANKKIIQKRQGIAIKSHQEILRRLEEGPHNAKKLKVKKDGTDSRIYYMDVAINDFKNFSANSEAVPPSKKAKKKPGKSKNGDKWESPLPNKVAEDDFVKPSDKIRIYYFFLGDLINVCIDALTNGTGSSLEGDAKDALKNLHLSLGTIKIYRKGKAHYYNIADMPIAVDYFVEWMMNNVVAQKKESYYFLYFIRDLASKLMQNLLGGGCFEDRTRQKVRFHLMQVNGTNRLPTKYRVDTNLRLKLAGNRKENVLIYPPTAYTATKDTIQHVLLYARTHGYVPNLQGDLTDTFRGIHHVSIGRQYGLVKSIKFNKVDSAVREFRYFGQNQTDKNLSMIGNVYNADIKMIGNGLFYPGMMIYVDPSGLHIGNPTESNSIARNLGLGGYHMVLRVNSSISRGKYETSVTAQWQFSGGKSEGGSIKDNSAIGVGESCEDLTSGIDIFDPQDGSADAEELKALQEASQKEAEAKTKADNEAKNDAMGEASWGGA